MLLSTYLLALFGIFTIVEGSRRSFNGLRAKPRGRALKQATRSEIVSRASRPRDFQRRQQASPVPIPGQCPDYTSTGSVPYARWNNLDYASAEDATYYQSVPTREACTKVCELDRTCIASTYNAGTSECFKIARTGNYYQGTFVVTTKGVTCESQTSVKSQFPDATCCTEYRAASP